MTIRYADHTNRKQTKQSEPIPGETQVKNNAGGYVYAVDKWSRLERFLILGSDGGTYYVRERELTRDNAQVVEACLAEDYARTIETIVDISDSGRAPKNDPAILALAVAAAHEKLEVRTMALAALPRVCRIPTHLFHFVAFVKGMRGFGPQLRKAIEAWYRRWTPEQLAYEVVKYQSRDGWSHKDVFRLAHPKLSAEAQAVARWAIGASLNPRVVMRKNQNPRASFDVTTSSGEGIVGVLKRANYAASGEPPVIIQAYEAAKVADEKTLIALIREHRLSREMVPSEKLASANVWDALLPNLGLTAVMRNLNKMTAVGLLAPLSLATHRVTQLLGDAEEMRRKRVHPLAILNALRVYASGKGDKGSLTWTPVQQVVDALDAAFYASFKNVVPTGKNMLLALDVSGSMTASIAGTGLSCREACAALALVTANVETNYAILGFTSAGRHGYGYRSENAITPLAISPRQRLDDVTKYLGSLAFGATDCALPMLHATKEKMDIDAFVVYTDSETWAGTTHPKQALASYRNAMNKPQAAQVVVGMTATEFTIADPNDPRTLDVVGFDTQTPEAISAFIR